MAKSDPDEKARTRASVGQVSFTNLLSRVSALDDGFRHDRATSGNPWTSIEASVMTGARVHSLLLLSSIAAVAGESFRDPPSLHAVPPYLRANSPHNLSASNSMTSALGPEMAVLGGMERAFPWGQSAQGVAKAATCSGCMDQPTCSPASAGVRLVCRLLRRHLAGRQRRRAAVPRGYEVCHERQGREGEHRVRVPQGRLAAPIPSHRRPHASRRAPAELADEAVSRAPGVREADARLPKLRIQVPRCGRMHALMTGLCALHLLATSTSLSQLQYPHARPHCARPSRVHAGDGSVNREARA